MKVVKILLVALSFIVVLYGALWFGFLKGYEYNHKHAILHADTIIEDLKNLREGNVKDVIDSLEEQLGIQIIEYQYSDKEFVNYIIGQPKSNSKYYKESIRRIKEYRDLRLTERRNSGVKEVCDSVCEVLNSVD